MIHSVVIRQKPPSKRPRIRSSVRVNNKRLQRLLLILPLTLSVDHVDRNTVSNANVKFLESITMIMFWSEFNMLWTKVTYNVSPELGHSRIDL